PPRIDLRSIVLRWNEGAQAAIVHNSIEMEHQMKKFLVVSCLLLAAVSASFAQSSLPVVHWRGIAGVITAQGVNNPISTRINSGTFAWTTRAGAATVDLRTGAVAFFVDGLVINGAAFSGTAGPIHSVIGTLVCNAGTDRENTHSTAAVNLSSRGH